MLVIDLRADAGIRPYTQRETFSYFFFSCSSSPSRGVT